MRRIEIRCSEQEYLEWLEAAGPRGMSQFIRSAVAYLLAEREKNKDLIPPPGKGTMKRARQGAIAAKRARQQEEKHEQRMKEARKRLLTKPDVPVLLRRHYDRLAERPHHPLCRCYICRTADTRVDAPDPGEGLPHARG